MKIEFRTTSIVFISHEETDRGITHTESVFHVGDNNKNRLIDVLCSICYPNSNYMVSDDMIEGVKLGIQNCDDGKIRFYILNFNMRRASIVIPKSYIESLIKLYSSVSMISYDDKEGKVDMNE